MGLLFKNNAETTLSGGINDSVTTISVASAAVFPTPDANNVFFATLDDGTNVETVKVTGISSNDLTVVREQDNTSAAAFSTGTKIELRLNAKVLDMGTASLTDLDGDTKIQLEESADEDKIRFDTGGTERVIIDSTGVGIGTSSPSVPLDIVTTLSSDTTTSPDTVLTIATTYSSTGADGGAGAGPRLEFKIPDDETNPITGAAIAGLKEDADDSDASAGMAFYISQNDTTLDEAVRIDHDGKVGIGTATPAQLFEVNGNGTKSRFTRTGSAGVVMEFVSGSTASGLVNVNGSGTLGFGGGGREKDLTIDSSGNIDIGSGTITRTGDLTIDVSGDILLDADGENIKFLDGGTERGQIDLGSANFTLRASTSDKDMIFRVNDGGSEIVALTIDASEAGAATFNDNVTAYSDERLKDNIETIENGLDKVEQLRGVTYTRDEKESIGVIAQEVEKILPEIVLTADDEMGTKSVDYSRLTAVLIEAVKDLSARVKELEDK